MRWLTSVTIALAMLLLPVSAAVGHAGLVSSTPEDGAALETAPEEIVLTFSEQLMSDLVEVSILGADGGLVAAIEAAQTPPPGTDVTFTWPSDLQPGDYSVAFRVVSADGHPVTGQISFSFANPPAESESAKVEEESAAPTPDQTPQEDAPSPSEPATQEEVVAVAEPAAAEVGPSIIGPLLIGAAVLVGAGVVVSIVMLARSRR